MAIYRLYPSKDSTLYTKQTDLNAGRDAMLELGSNKFGEAMRPVIQFDQTEVESTITDILGGTSDYSASMKLYTANASQLGEDTKVHFHPLAESWVEGLGHYGDAPYNSVGVSWKFRDGVTLWTTTHPSPSSSLHPGDEEIGGGVWINEAGGNILSSSYDHLYGGTVDITADLTPFVKATVAGEIENNGLVLKMDIEEFVTSSISYMQLFSKDTNTVYYPHLELTWDDSNYNSSLDHISGSTGALDIKFKEIRESYPDNGKVRFRLHARAKYPAKVFRTTNTYLTNSKLDELSYWGIKDDATGEMVVDFDTFATKLSADDTSSYFDVYMDNLFVERYYRLVVKTVVDGTTHIIESDNPFKLQSNG